MGVSWSPPFGSASFACRARNPSWREASRFCPRMMVMVMLMALIRKVRMKTPMSMFDSALPTIFTPNRVAPPKISEAMTANRADKNRLNRMTMRSLTKTAVRVVVLFFFLPFFWPPERLRPRSEPASSPPPLLPSQDSSLFSVDPYPEDFLIGIVPRDGSFVDGVFAMLLAIRVVDLFDDLDQVDGA